MNYFSRIHSVGPKKCTNKHNIHDALGYGHNIPTRIDACCNFHENVVDLKQNTSDLKQNTSDFLWLPLVGYLWLPSVNFPHL